VGRDPPKSEVFDLAPFKLRHEVQVGGKRENQGFTGTQPSQQCRAVAEVFGRSQRVESIPREIHADKPQYAQVLEVDAAESRKQRPVRQEPAKD
jgi:hypothetical protein